MQVWYHLVRFPCPTCGQRLVVERSQVRRGQTVTCQDCNTDIRLAARGAAVSDEATVDQGHPMVTVELSV
jgi:predicted RNA-binding Zn-ribbon protein involved in translation (DUF1610 family)